MSESAIIRTMPLGFQWETFDPFLFCVHHDDYYPNGNSQLGPDASLSGRNIGQDFEPKDGWRMYHGKKIPGFPVHPHRGFETVTIVRRGFIDHADSLGAAGRYGGGDVQWMTAGKGVQHSEMFPLLKQDQTNPLELFQIWLNLPRVNKMVEPHFSMLWRESIPRRVFTDSQGKQVNVDVVAGELVDARPLAPPPDSWAASADSHVAIWTIKMNAGAQWTLPAAVSGLNRTLYFFAGSNMRVNGERVSSSTGLLLRSEFDVVLENGDNEAELLLLQGRPINEPVVQYGPFVMNTKNEIQQAFVDYQNTQFGGWPWGVTDPVHGATRGRFAKHTDGRVEEPGDC